MFGRCHHGHTHGCHHCHRGGEWMPAIPSGGLYPSSGMYPPPITPGGWISPGGDGWIPPQVAGGCSCCHGPNHIGYSWMRSERGCVPPNAVLAGNDRDGGPIYAGRAYHDGDLLPAKVTPTHGCAFVSFNGSEISKHEYEVLCSHRACWIFDGEGRVPMGAISVGRTSCGEPLYMGRVRHDGTLTPGKIHPSHRVLYIPYGGQEMSFRQYEVLVIR